MKLKPLYAVILLFLAILLMAGCSVTRNFQPREHLLIKNKTEVSRHTVPAEDLEAYLQQVPNKKLFGLFRANIAIYNMASKGKDSKFKSWLRRKVGSEPVKLDTNLVAVTVKQMRLYMGNRGFFKSSVSDSVILKRRKAKVIYRVHAGKPYTVRNLRFAIPDTQVASFVYRDTAKCLIRRGENFDSYILDEERTRIYSNLQNYGFYKFSASYIKYTVDSSLRQNKCDVTLEIINEVVPAFDLPMSVLQVPHKRYFINNIYVYPEFDHLVTFTGKYDTLVRSYQGPGKNQPPSTYYFLYKDRFKMAPRTIAQSIFITPRSFFNMNDVDQSYAQLSSLQAFRYINIRFKEAEVNNEKGEPENNRLDCQVELSRAPSKSFTVTTDGTNSGGAFGVQASLGFMNRNVFRGAQLLKINLSGSLQMQATEKSTVKTFFNVIELGANAGITFPQFLIPVRPEKLPKYFKPKTTVSVGYNYQRQQHYTRHISNISFGYSWIQKETMSHLLNPVELSLVKIYTDHYFDSTLEATQDLRLKNQYTDHLVAGLKYTFNYSTQQLNTVKNFTYIRANLETGGNLIYALDNLLSVKRTGSSFTLFGLPYAMFVRPDVDFRFYNILGKSHSMVYRFYGGIGVPYGNSSMLPFEKAFFAGGANGMRGWRMYRLGPGSYRSENEDFNYNQIGDIQLEANVEYRFPVWEWIRGAVFLDAGNIWLLQNSKDLPGGKFTFPGFANHIALDGGIGIRLDFDFFIFRFDPAIPLRDPSHNPNNRWTFSKMQISDIVWNFGIGYPF